MLQVLQIKIPRLQCREDFFDATSIRLRTFIIQSTTDLCSSAKVETNQGPKKVNRELQGKENLKVGNDQYLSP